MSEAAIDELDAAGCADALSASVREERLLAARRLRLVAHWADTHPPRPITGDSIVRRWGSDEVTQTRTRLNDNSRTIGLQLGADGTPMVSEFAAVELGVHLQTTTSSAMALLRDTLEIRHRLPRLWAALMAGDVEVWKARRAAALTRVLSLQDALTVDAEVVDALEGLPFGRALDVIEGRVIAADPAGHESRRLAEAEQRYVAIGRRPNPAGLRTLVAQSTVGDIARLDAMVDYLADLLAGAGDTDPKQVRRAKALGILADPARACLLLAESQPAESQPAESQPDQPADDYSPVRAGAELGKALRTLGNKALGKLRPRTVLYVHLSEEAVQGVPGTQVARTSLGPAGLEQLREWLGRDAIIVKPVIDLAGQISTDAYEIPAAMAEHVRLREPFEVFPFGTLPSDKSDEDHTKAYVPPDEGGPPGQTSTENLGPLGRTHHNAKTFGGFTCYQPLPGLYLWLTPAGIWYRVDHTGTHLIGRDVPEILTHTGDLPGSGASRMELAYLDQIKVELAA